MCLNKLHDDRKKENSTDDMTSLMKQFDKLAELSGSQVCVIHHSNKSGGVRGSSAIEGWADYIVRLEKDSPGRTDQDDDDAKQSVRSGRSQNAAVLAVAGREGIAHHPTNGAVD